MINKGLSETIQSASLLGQVVGAEKLFLSGQKTGRRSRECGEILS